jgi:hypothetical protein
MDKFSANRGGGNEPRLPGAWRTLFMVLAMILAAIALWGAVASSRRVFRLEERVKALEQPKPYPLGEQMGYLQRYVEKLYFAGQAKNWELADFYAREVDETVVDIMSAKVVKEGVEVSKLMTTMLPPVEQGLQEALQNRDQELFQTRYGALVDACNACHQEAKHGFMKITIPDRPSVTNQSFAPEREAGGDP